MRNKLIFVTIISILAFTFTATGQKQIDSPYSRFNLGTLEPQGSFRSFSMGTTGTAMRDNSAIYFLNPSSYSSLDTISFIFDFGLDYGRNFITGTSSKYSSDDMNFHHLIMGFPIKKGWGFAAGILPMSSAYYKIAGSVSSTDQQYDPNVGEYTALHTGDGGITKLFFGTGFMIGKSLSIGANLTFLTGQIKRTDTFSFGDFYSTYHNRSQENLELHGIGFDYGLQYTAQLIKNHYLTIGASLSSGNDYSSKYSQISEKFNAFGVIDTITYSADNKAKTYIPGTLRLGIAFGKKNKYTTGIDFTTTKWSALKIPGNSGYAADTRTLAIGGEFIPDKFSNYSFLSRIEYRIGGHIGDNYLILNGEQIKEYGASFGLGVPLGRSLSKLNLYIDYTTKTGSSAFTLKDEHYLTMGISLNFYDNWFQKRKYD